MLSFENFVKSMPPSLSEFKVTPSFCFAFKIPDDRAVTNVNTYCRLQKHVGPIMEFLAEIQECAWLVYNAPLSLIVRPVPEA